jgi:hypothetical protein
MPRDNSLPATIITIRAMSATGLKWLGRRKDAGP